MLKNNLNFYPIANSIMVLLIQLKLKVLWFKESLGLAIDQELCNQVYPLTSYYMWPKTEAWEQLKLELDSRPWLTKEKKVQVLNLSTEIMNYWKEHQKVESTKQFSSYFQKINFVNIKN